MTTWKNKDRDEHSECIEVEDGNTWLEASLTVDIPCRCIDVFKGRVLLYH